MTTRIKINPSGVGEDEGALPETMTVLRVLVREGVRIGDDGEPFNDRLVTEEIQGISLDDTMVTDTLLRVRKGDDFYVWLLHNVLRYDVLTATIDYQDYVEGDDGTQHSEYDQEA